MSKIQNSPIEQIKFKNINFLLKRDDLLDDDFSGNKARKFYYFLKNNFPKIKTIISHGSNQSNAMYSLSVLAKLKNWNFKYFVNHIPSFLRNDPNGNYKYALQNGMDIIEHEEFDKSTLDIKEDELFISEGGAINEAKYGIKILADEINTYIKENHLKNIKVFLPSGTGTTAVFLAKYLDVEVLTCACVGSDEYLIEQFKELETNIKLHPTILPKEKKFHFGKLYKSSYDTWLDLNKQTNIEFDLLYDPIAWQTLFYNKEEIDLNKILYIHQGGLIGNITMIKRYERKYNNHKILFNKF